MRLRSVRCLAFACAAACAGETAPPGPTMNHPGSGDDAAGRAGGDSAADSGGCAPGFDRARPGLCVSGCIGDEDCPGGWHCEFFSEAMAGEMWACVPPGWGDAGADSATAEAGPDTDAALPDALAAGDSAAPPDSALPQDGAGFSDVAHASDAALPWDGPAAADASLSKDAAVAEMSVSPEAISTIDSTIPPDGACVCPAGFECDTDGNCVCVPACAGKLCGDDGCGGSCGGCGANEACLGGLCICQPACAGKQCGDDGCFGSCGACAPTAACVAGACVCQPSCGGKACGGDGCGGSCGDCGAGQACNGWQCVTCSCDGKACGDDGCGKSCGSCGEIAIPPKCNFCWQGQCTTGTACDNQCCWPFEVCDETGHCS